MRVLLVVNPAASSVTPRARADVEHVLHGAHDLDLVETARRDHAGDLARDAVAAGYDVVAVLAGDGTLNETADGLVGTDVALAPLPGGSTNVFARTLGVEYSPVRAADQLVASLERGTRRRVGVGVAEHGAGAPRHFLFHLGVGFDAAIIRRIEQHAEWKRHFAHPAFAATALSTWLRHYDRSTQVRFTVGDEVVATGPYAVISNSDPYAYVGRRRLHIAPAASLDDELTLTVLRSLRGEVVVRAAMAAVGTTRYLTSSPDVVQRADLDDIDVAADAPFPWQVDGDYLGEVDHLSVRFRPDCLTLIVP